MKTKYVFVPLKCLDSTRAPHSFIVYIGQSKHDKRMFSILDNVLKDDIFEPYSQDYVDLIINNKKYKPYVHHVTIQALYDFYFGSLSQRGDLYRLIQSENLATIKRLIKSYKDSKQENDLFSFNDFSNYADSVLSCPF